MVTAVSKYLERLDYIEANLENEAYRIIAQIQETIIEYNTEKQLFEKGIDSKGERLEPYSPYTIALKKLKGEPYNRTTLLDEGDFYQGFYVIANDGKFFLLSSDEKTDELIAKYGKNIFGLTEEHNDKLNKEEIYPRLLRWILTQLLDTA